MKNDETLKQLRKTPTHFKRAADGLSDAQLRRPPAKGEWSIVELLAHLRGCADVQGGWITRILGEDTPSIRYHSPRTGMRKTDYVNPDFHETLRGFTQQRNALVKTLSALSEREWSRHAAFTGTTPGWTRTVFEAAHGIAVHEHAHFAQITSTAEVARRS
jgi:uncharacterized damage-inducible protein DinB